MSRFSAPTPKRHRRSGPPERALSLPLLFPPVFVAVYLLHFMLLRLPYYWDEGGYYIPAAWDFWRLGTLVPVSTVRNAHPPLPAVLIAGWWKLTGFHVYSTRLLMCLVTTVALLGIYRLARQLAGETMAFAVTVLTAAYPVWFAQSTLAHADMFAAAATMWALSFYFAAQPATAGDDDRSAASRAVNVALCFSLAVLSKETAIVTPAALFLLEAARAFQHRRDANQLEASASLRARIPMLTALAFPALPLVCWYAYHRLATGFTFGNPEYLRYNATANLSLLRVLLSLWHRLIHLTVHMNLYVPLLLTCATLMLPRLPDRRRLPGSVLSGIAVVLVANWVAFSVLGGALLTRYLLPAYPLVLLVCVVTWQRRITAWLALAAVSLAGFAAGSIINPPYPFAPEDNLAYADMIRLHQEAIAVVGRRFPGATVLTAWPVTADLQRPELGYTRTPSKTVQIDNFTADEIGKAAQRPGDYNTAIVFSTKYNPPPGGLNLAARTGAADSRYFDAHRDLLPNEVAHALGGTVVWQAERKGQWAAVLHFDRSYDARLQPGRTPLR